MNIQRILWRVALLASLFCLLNSSPIIAKEFHPFCAPSITIETPDKIMIPNAERLTLEAQRVHPYQKEMVMFLYRDSKYQYFSKGEEIFPYMEMIFIAESGIDLMLISFINKDLKIELYENDCDYGGPNRRLVKNIYDMDIVKVER